MIDLRIALCDDDKSCREEVTQLLKEYIQQNSNPFDLVSYASGTELLEDTARTGSYDVYILDILMPRMNGIELGVRLRELDPDSKIIYLTSSPDYAIQSFQAKPWEYLLKPVKPQELFPALDEALSVLTKKRDAGMLVKSAQGSIRLPFDNILYAQLNKKSIHYHLINGKLIESTAIRTGFSEAVQDMLRDNRFFMCSASIVVNLYHIQAIGNDTLTFRNGESIYLSRRANRQLRSVWANFWMNEEDSK